MTTAALFQAKVSNEYGDVFPQAQVAILESHLIESTSRVADDIEEEYKTSKGIIGGTYKIMYFGNPLARAQGFISRPLRSFNDGEFSDVFEVDIEYSEVQALLASGLSDNEKLERIVKADLARRFR